MRKILSVTIVFVMLMTIIFTGSWTNKASGATTAAANQFNANLPDYRKLDSELINEAKAHGENVVGKELHGYNGGSYLKPGNLDNLEPKDVRGEKKGIAILVDFPVNNTEGRISDVPGVNYKQIPASKFVELLNGKTYNPYDLDIFSSLREYEGIRVPTDRTLNNYFKEVSYGQFSINVDVAGWYTLPHDYNYYMGQDKGYYNENGDAHIGEMISDAIDLAKENGVDFSQYAVPAQPGDFEELYGNTTTFTDKNGNVINQIVPNIFIIHRGSGAEYNLDPSIIWSHKWDILSANYFGRYYQTGEYPSDDQLNFKIVDGVVVNTYNICPEVGQDITGYYYGIPRNPSPADPGVFAHEFSHVLGLPDQYDYGYDSMGTGMYTLMASGSYGRDIQNRYYSGFCPVHLDAWSKYYLGFASPVEINKNTKNVTLRPVENSPDIYKIVVPGSNGKEYFLLENRQPIGYDRGLAYNVDNVKLHGLVVYHIDENVLMRNFNRPNEAANWDWNNRGVSYKDPKTGENHYAISVVQADGKWDLEKNINDADSTDTFGKGTTSGKMLLSPDIKAIPNTLSYYIWGTDSRSSTGITLDNIIEKADGTVTLNVYFK